MHCWYGLGLSGSETSCSGRPSKLRAPLSLLDFVASTKMASWLDLRPPLRSMSMTLLSCVIADCAASAMRALFMAARAAGLCADSASCCAESMASASTCR